MGSENWTICELDLFPPSVIQIPTVHGQLKKVQIQHVVIFVYGIMTPFYLHSRLLFILHKYLGKTRYTFALFMF